MTYYNTITERYEPRVPYIPPDELARSDAKVSEFCSSLSFEKKCCFGVAMVLVASTVVLITCASDNCFSKSDQDSNTDICSCSSGVQISAIVGEVIGGLGSILGCIKCCYSSSSHNSYESITIANLK